MSDTVSRTMSVVQPNLPEGLAGKNIQLPSCRAFQCVRDGPLFFSRRRGGGGMRNFQMQAIFFWNYYHSNNFFFFGRLANYLFW